jgi:predicted TIM-barrel fold metal-dependent hydrolase
VSRIFPSYLIFLFLLAVGPSCTSEITASDDDDDGTETTSSDNDSGSSASSAPIDVHVHALIGSGNASLTELSAALADQGIEGNVLMSAPVALLSEDPEANDSSELFEFAASAPGVYRVLYGGSELEPLLHAAARTETFTEELVYPNGGAPTNIDEALAEMTAVAADPTAWEAEFRERAETAAASGSYAGFGEMAALHQSLREGHPFIEFAADHPWMLTLAEIAADYGLPIDLHMEATEAAVTQLESLLAHDRDAKIIWDHAGWSNTGLATAASLSALMAAHENLYLSVKLRESDTEELEAGAPLDPTGTLKTEWAELIEAYADRIMLGTDVKHWQEQGGQVATPADVLISTWESVDSFLDQLPEETARKVKHDTAAELFGF